MIYNFRVEWSLRTCVSVAVCAALALYFPSRSALNFRGGLDIGPPFACYVCIVVKDNNLGGTISNSWGCLYGSLLASLVCFTLQSIVQDEQYSAEIALPLLLIFSFILNYVELHPLAKKFGLGVLALNFLTTNTQPAMQTWLLFANILVGIATGLVGNILPWPRLSSDLVDKRALFCAEAMSAVLNDITLTWRYATCPLIIPTYQHSSSSCYMRELKADNPLFPSSRSIWKLFKHVLLAVIAFKKKGSNMHWSSNHSHHKNHVYMRLEMIKYTSGIATILIQLTKEARFGPLRSIAIVRYDYFNFLMRDLLIVISIFENRLRDLRRHPEQHDPLFAFQSRPTFRAAVHRYNKCLGATLVEAALWLRSPKKTLSYSNISSMVQLRRARDELDEEYADARAEIYYNEDPDKSKQMTSFGAMNQNSFMFLYDACFLLIEQYWSTFQDPIESRDEEDNRVNRVSDTDTQMAHTLTMFRSIGKDLFLSQTHLFTLSRSGNLTTVIRQRLLQSLSVAVSMTGAGAYGFYTGRPQVFLAAFTIASISGGSVSGATTLTSVDRSIGTIVGSVFALIVAYILKQWGSNDFIQTNIFIWAVVVLWQLPCTFVRTLQSHSHLGVVSGFTAPVLLLIPNVVDTQAVDRIIDTYVGVGIYLIVDYIVAPVYSDDALLTDIRAVFKGIKIHFSEFVDVFRSHGAATSILSRESSLTESISHCKDLSVYASIIPLPWRPPPLEKRIVNELISGQEAAHRSIRGMMWALIACKRGVATDFSFLLRPIRGQLNKVSEFVDTVSFYLQSNAEHMHEWRQIQREWRGCSSASLIEGRYISPKLKQALSSAVSIWSTGEEESEEVREFFARFEDLIHNLQKAFRECSSSIGELAGYGSAEELRLRLKSSSIISNEEVKTVNSVLCCTKDLVQALKTISASMTRLRAYRDIRLTQSGIRDQVSNEKAL